MPLIYLSITMTLNSLIWSISKKGYKIKFISFSLWKWYRISIESVIYSIASNPDLRGLIVLLFLALLSDVFMKIPWLSNLLYFIYKSIYFTKFSIYSISSFNKFLPFNTLTCEISFKTLISDLLNFTYQI